MIFNQTYEDSQNSHLLFEDELDLAFFNSEGFDEGVYRNAYNQINRITHQSSSINIQNQSTSNQIDRITYQSNSIR